MWTSLHLVGHGGVNALLNHPLELVHIVGNAAAGASAGEGRADDKRVASDLSGDLQGLLNIVGSTCQREKDSV